jgi:ribosomal protein S14
MIRNTTLPPRVRAEAQLQLTQMHCYTRGTQIRNRCIMGGRARGIFRDFKMTRVRTYPAINDRHRRTHSTPPIKGRSVEDSHIRLLTVRPVQFPTTGHGRKHSRCQEGQLVKFGQGWEGKVACATVYDERLCNTLSRSGQVLLARPDAIEYGPIALSDRLYKKKTLNTTDISQEDVSLNRHLTAGHLTPSCGHPYARVH